jgi:hypothetical protein
MWVLLCASYIHFRELNPCNILNLLRQNCHCLLHHPLVLNEKVGSNVLIPEMEKHTHSMIFIVGKCCRLPLCLHLSVCDMLDNTSSTQRSQAFSKKKVDEPTKKH